MHLNLIVVEVLDEDSRVEGCFKNKKVFIEELSSAQTVLIASHIWSVLLAGHVKAMPLSAAALCLDRRPASPRAGVQYRTLTLI